MLGFGLFDYYNGYKNYLDDETYFGMILNTIKIINDTTRGRLYQNEVEYV